MATTKVTANVLADDSITQAKLADDAVGAAELASNAVVNASIASGAAIDMDKLDGDSLASAITDFAQDDLVILSDTSDSGNLKSMTASNLEDAIFGNISGDVTLAAGGAATLAAAQTNITSLGTLTALTVDDVAINGKVITMTGSASDTVTLTAGTNGTLDITTTDAAAAAANITITADGTFEAIGSTVTLDSSGAINLEPAAGSVILLDGTISVDAGVITGATSITSTAFVGTLSTASQTNITGVGTISTGVWQGTAIASTYIAADAITGAKIADDAINSEHYTDGSIDNAHLADDAVNSDEIAAGAIDLAHMSVNSIDSDQYVDGSIDNAHLADDAVGADELAANAVVTASIVDDNITFAKLEDRYTELDPLGSHGSAFAVVGTNGCTFTATMTGNCVFTLSAMAQGQVIDLVVNGNYTITLAQSGATFNKIGSTDYDGSTTNLIQIVCADDASSEIYYYSVAPYTSDTTP